MWLYLFVLLVKWIDWLLSHRHNILFARRGDSWQQAHRLQMTHHRLRALLLGAIGAGRAGGDDDEGQGARHLAQGGADVVDRLATQFETIHLQDLV